MFSPEINKLFLRLNVVDGDRAALYQLLHQEISQRDVLSPWRVGAISGNMKLRRVVDEERNKVESILES